MRKLLFVILLLLSFSICAYTTGVLKLIAPTSMEDRDSEWNRFEQVILSSPDKEIVIYWHGVGGYVDTEEKFVQVLREAKSEGKHIVIVITGATGSSHADVICNWNDVVFKKGYLVMHPVRNGDGTILSNDSMETLDPCVRKGYITERDKYNISYYGMRIYVYPDGSKRETTD